MGKYEDLEREEDEYEASRLVRDSMAIPVVTAIAAGLTGPVGAAAVAIGMGAKAIADKQRRERERDGD